MNGTSAIPTLHTRRLTLRAPDMDDIDAITAIIQDREIVRWLARVPWPYERAHAEMWVTGAQEIAAAGEEIAFAIDHGGLIGMISVRNLRDTPQLGYWLGRQWWGRGLMTEAARAVVDFSFDRLNAEAIASGTFEGNFASQSVLKRLGFVVAGESTAASLFHGSDQKHIDMRLTREAFEANRL